MFVRNGNTNNNYYTYGVWCCGCGCVGGCLVGCGCDCGCDGGSFVRLFVCSFFVVSLRRVVPCGVFVVVCCVSLSVRVRCEILGLVEKTNYRESICQWCFH